VPTTYPYIVNHFKETAVHVSTYGGVRGRQRLLTLPPTLMPATCCMVSLTVGTGNWRSGEQPKKNFI